MIEHCRDFRRVKKVWDGKISISSAYYYLLEVKNGEDVGCWCFQPYGEELIIHVNLSLKCRGKAAAKSAVNAIKWIFDNTEYDVIHAYPPYDKKAAQRLAVFVGFEFMFEKNGNRCYKLERSVTVQKMAV